MINQGAVEYFKHNGYTRREMLEYLASVDHKYLAALVDFLPGRNLHIAVTSHVEEIKEGHGPTMIRFLKYLVDHHPQDDLCGSMLLWLEDGMWPWLTDLPRRFPMITYGRQIEDSFTMLIPDPAYIGSYGYKEDLEDLAKIDEAVPWEKKLPVVFWRGASSGTGTGMELPRVKLCVKAAGLADQSRIDIALSKVVNTYDTELVSIVSQFPILKKPVPFEGFLNFRYQIDVDGMSCAWRSFYLKLASKCCVLKVQSPNLQWYYDRLVPWKHYIPIFSDCSDLEEAVAWCAAHDDACREIGEAGSAFIADMDIEAEVVKAGNLIAEILPCQKDETPFP